jgi:hypothetical protein
MTLEQLSQEFSNIFIRISLIFYLFILALGHYFDKNVNEMIFLVVLVAFHWAINKTVKIINSHNLDIKENMYAIFEGNIISKLLLPISGLTAIHYVYNAFFHERTAPTSSVIAFVGSMFLIAIISKLEKRKILKMMQQN